MQKNQLIINLLQPNFIPNRQTIKMISQTNNKPHLLSQIVNNKHSLFVLVSFMDFNDVKSLHIAMRDNRILPLCQQTDKLLTSFIFTKQYVNKIDRTMAYFMYENKYVSEIDNFSVLNIAQKSTSELTTIMNSYDSLFNSLTQKCSMNQQEVNSLIRIITQPDLPLPSSIRSQIGKYCCSNFQLFLCAKVTKTQTFFCPESQFQLFKTHILNNQDNYLINILSSNQHHQTQSFSIVQKLKQLFYNPQIFVEKLTKNTQDFAQNNQAYNFFIIMVKLATNMVASIKLRLQSVQFDPYVYFTELMLRYSLYKFSMLQLQQSFGAIFASFESIVREALNIGKSKNQMSEFSLWKIMMKLFSSQLEQEIKFAFPTYMNLTHKSKLTLNNNLYQQLAKIEGDQNLNQQFQQHQGSPVLEYLMNEQNIDNAQVLMADFIEMLIDLSVDEYNVLLCGHSEQFLGGLYEQWEEAFLKQETQILYEVSLLTDINEDQEKQLIQSQMQFISEKLNIKPRTLKQLLERTNFSKSILNVQNVDRELVQINRKYFGQSYELSSSQKSHKSSLTADDSDKEETYEIDLEGLQYFSQIDEEEIIQEIDV